MQGEGSGRGEPPMRQMTAEQFEALLIEIRNGAAATVTDLVVERMEGQKPRAGCSTPAPSGTRPRSRSRCCSSMVSVRPTSPTGRRARRWRNSCASGRRSNGPSE